ncbi:replication protein RepA, partial [Streptococcus agalactiae]
EAYGLMVPESQQEVDSYKQLRRRLTNVIYHFKIREDDGNFKYKTITFTPEDFERHNQEQIEKFAYLFDKFNPNVLNYDFTKDAFHLSMNPINNKKKKATTLKLTKAESNSK